MAKKSAHKSSLNEIIQENLTSFILGLIIVFLLLLAGIRYVARTNKDLMPANIANLFGANEGETMQVPDTYTVSEGDDLCQIARQYYDDCKFGYNIANENNLADPNNIEVGQKLKLPVIDAKKATPAAPAAPGGQISATETAQAAKDKVYVVKQGDYLWKIAQEQYGDPYMWPKIASANALVDPDFLSVGSKLQIPR